MKIIFLNVLLVLTIGVTGCAQAGGGGIKMTVSDQQSLAIENLSLIAKDFWQAYRSDDVSKRRLAEMYLIGVLDSTEGEKWCGYKIALPHSVLDQIHIGFKNASKEMMDDRASNTINKIMSNILPCKETK
ncbi:Rap1a/Tai family immunity protein [Aliikangiella maris]|uniref:Rap1a immunity protein domain-containing protein n=2 Tax=Aliikangiella maris TaxID=3162458 RepID=A0ABV3MLM9_9GAMM